jgi:hypothetical protein
MAKKKPAKASPSFEERYPNIDEWLCGGGLIVLGPLDTRRPFARAVFKGKTVWSGEPVYATQDAALAALDEAIHAYLDDQGYFAGDEGDD